MKANPMQLFIFWCLLLSGACNKAAFYGENARLRPLPHSQSGTGFSTQTAATTAIHTSVSDQPSAAAADDHQPGQHQPDFDTGLAVAKTRIGVNFDDGGSIGSDADRDYNDAVLCFRGEFRVDLNRARVLASKAQTITAFFTRRAACDNAVNIMVLHPSGQQDGARQYRVQQNGTINFNLQFFPGSELKVELLAGSGCNFFGTPRSLNDPDAAKIEIDVCRTDGE